MEITLLTACLKSDNVSPDAKAFSSEKTKQIKLQSLSTLRESRSGRQVSRKVGPLSTSATAPSIAVVIKARVPPCNTTFLATGCARSCYGKQGEAIR